MSTTFAGLLLCLMVLAIAVVASGVATALLVASLKQRPRSQGSGAMVLRPNAPLAGGLSLQEAAALRNLVFRTVAPRPEEVVLWARSRYPNATTDQLAQHIISAEAHKCGFIGFITGVPGITALPLTLPVDLYTTGRLQASMIQALVYLYDVDMEPDEIDRLKWMVLLGGGSVAKTGAKFLLRIVGPSALKAMPILGAVAGYTANYLLAQAAGRAAMAHFSGRLARGDTGRLLEATRTIGTMTSAAPPRLRELPPPDTTPLFATPAAVVPVEAARPVTQGEQLSRAVGNSQSSSSLHCPSCDTPNPANYRFCSGCGINLSMY